MTIRAMLRRVLVQDLACEVTEAANGLDALEQIGRHKFDLVILDMTMPVMDGIETLHAIRSSAAHARLPVVMLSGAKGEAEVRRVVELGITEYLTKPLSQNQMSERLARVMANLRQEAVQPVGPAPSTTGGGPSRQRVLVVDEDPDVRHFVGSVLGPHHDVETAESGAQALRRCLDPAQPVPKILLLGAEIGPVTPAMFMAKLRALPHLGPLRVFALAQRGARENDDSYRMYDDVVTLTFVPEGFLHEFHRVAGVIDSPLQRLLALRPSLRKDCIAATEQVFGMMLFTEVELASREDAWPADAELVHALLDVKAAAEGITLSLLVEADVGSAATFTSQMVGAPAEELHEADLLATVAEISNIIGGRLQNRLVDAGIAARLQLPRTGKGVAGSGPTVDPDAIRLPFRSTDRAFLFRITLVASVAETGQP